MDEDFPLTPSPRRAPTLSRVTRGRKPCPDRIILYAPPGWGKTTWAAYLRRALVVTTPGEDRIHKLIEQGLVPPVDVLDDTAESWADVNDVTDELLTGPHNYETVVYDTGNGLERLAHEAVCQEQFDGNWGEHGFGGFGRGEKVSTNSLWVPFLAKLERLRQRRRVRVVLLAHVGVVSVKNPEGLDYDKIGPAFSKPAWAFTARWADMVLYGTFDTQ